MTNPLIHAETVERLTRISDPQYTGAWANPQIAVDIREALAFINYVALAAKQQKVMNPDAANPIYDMFDPAMMGFELP